MFEGPFSNIWNIRKLFYNGWAPYYGIMVRAFPWISLLSVGILSNPFNWKKVLSGAKGCYLIWLDI